MNPDKLEKRVFNLRHYANQPAVYCVVITSEDTDVTVVQAAWSYALRYTAKGLDLPDQEAALDLMQQRHPSWQFIRSNVQTVPVDLTKADGDKPENE